MSESSAGKMVLSNSVPGDENEAPWVLRRYQAVGLILVGVLLGSAALFSRDSEFFSTQPRYPYRLALTFDDGPHPAFTDRLLRVLNEHQVAATFFVVGSQAERYPVLLEQLVRRGQEIANHTFHHRNLTKLSNLEVARELDTTRRLIESATGKESVFFRPPGGRYDEHTLKVISEHGYRMILWTVLTQDHAAPSANTIHERVMASAQDGGVVLLHSGVESTLEALPRIIRDLRARGFQFLTVSEMLQETIDPRVLSKWYLPRKAPEVFSEDENTLASTHSDTSFST